MRVLVTFAVEAEFAPWRKMRPFVRRKTEGLELWKTEGRECDIYVLLTGIGEVASVNAMDLMMRSADSDKFFEVCISSGLAGALHSQYKVGEVLVARSLRTYAVHADLKSDRIVNDSKLYDLAVSSGAKSAEAFYMAARVATTAKEKSDFARLADAVDMESFGIAKESTAWGARTIAIRAISDGADTDLPIDFNRTLNSSNQVSIPRVLTELAKHPLALPGLIEFGKQSRKAAESLAHFLEGYVLRVAQLESADAVKKVAVS